MFWGAISFLFAVMWIAMFIVLGLSTLAKGHTLLFWIGIIFPVLWIIGAFMAPTEKAIARGA